MFHWIYKFVSFGRVFSLTLGTVLLLSSCSNLTSPSDEKPEEPVSVFTGKPGGLKLSDFNNKDQAGSSMPVNAILWRASLDIASFVPLDDVDTLFYRWISNRRTKDDEVLDFKVTVSGSLSLIVYASHNKNSLDFNLPCISFEFKILVNSLEFKYFFNCSGSISISIPLDLS